MKISSARYLALAAAASVFAVAIPGVASATETGTAAQPSASASPSSPGDPQEAPPAEEVTEQEEATEQEESPKQSGDSSGETSAEKADSSPGISIQANPDCKGHGRL